MGAGSRSGCSGWLLIACGRCVLYCLPGGHGPSAMTNNTRLAGASSPSPRQHKRADGVWLRLAELCADQMAAAASSVRCRQCLAGSGAADMDAMGCFVQTLAVAMDAAGRDETTEASGSPDHPILVHR